MANPVIATVQSVTAPISVRDEAGSLRQLSVGDQLRLGDLVLTESGQAANLLMTDGTVVTLTGAKETLVSNDLMATTASSAQEAAISEASLDQLINEVRDQVATNTPEADQILAALQGDGTLDNLLEETAAGLTGEGEGEGHSFVILDRIDEQIELALTTTTPFIVTEEQEPFEGVQSASFNLTTESDVAPNIAQFTDNFVNGVSYTTSSGLTGLTGDAGEPGSFRYNDGDTITFSIGAVIIAEFSADLIQGPYLFIQDLKGLSLSETNDQFVENVAIFLQALDSDLDDGNNIDGLQTQDISAEEASVAFSNYIEITAAIRTLFENYVDPATGQALNLMNSGKGQVSDALSKAGVEFTAKSEMEGVSYEVNSANGGTVVIDEDGNFTFTPNGELSGEQAFAYTVTNNSGDTFEMTRVVNLSDTDTLTGSVRMNSFETLAMQHVVDTISELAGERDPETMDARTEDTWGWFEEGTESDRVVNYSTAPETLEIDDSGIKFVVDASMLAYGYVPKQINDDSMMNNMELSDVSVRLLDNDGAPIANRSLSIEFDAETKTGVVTLSADDETSLDDLAAEVEDGLLENLAFDYTIWDWTVPVKVEGAGAIDAYKSHLSANPADIVEDGVYSQFVVNSTLAFDEAQKLTVKFSPEGSGTDFAEYSDDFSVPIQYRNGDGEWVDMQVLDETYTRADYDKPLPIFEFELAAGSTAVEIRIPVFDDPYIESTEIIDMLVEGDNFYSENIQAKILDNDSANTTPIVEVNLAVVNEDDGYASLTFSLVDQDGNLVTDTSDTTITYQTADLSAKAGLDYTAIPNDGDTGTALIIAGESTVTIQVPIIDDSIIEQTEFFKIDVLSVSDNAVLGDPEASVRIYDNDGMTITGDAQQEGTNITYTVVLSSELPSGEKTITLTPTNSGATASVHDDYSLTPVSVTYTDGDLNTQTISANSDGTFTLPDEVTTFQASYSTVIDNTPDGGVNTSGDETARLQVQVEYQSGPETLTVTGLGEATILDANSPEADSVEVTGGEDDSFITITLVGSDIDLNDSIETFTLSNLPANGTLYTDAALTTLAVADTSYAASDDELTLYFVPDENWNGETNFNFTANDGELDSKSATATITINGAEDPSDITVETGDSDTGAVTEDDSDDLSNGNLITSGTLTVNDVDGDGAFNTTATFTAAGSTNASALGALTIDASGNWSYSVDNSLAAVQGLDAGEQIVEVFTVATADGNDTQTVTITIHGTNDVATITGDTGSVTEDDTATLTTSGNAVVVTDTDAGESLVAVQTSTAGTYGSFRIDANGNWSYSADNSQSAIQALGDGDKLTDSFTVTSADGTATNTVVITINGTNDVPTITGDTGSVTEDDAATLTTSGNAVVVTDTDAGESLVAVQTNTAGTYGSFSIDANGNWSYSADNSQSAIQALGADDTLTDSFTVNSADGTATNTVVITIHGTNDAPTLSPGRIILSETFESTNGSDIESRPNGWYVEKGSNNAFTGSSGVMWTVDAAGIEIQGNVGGSAAYEGSQHAELDSHGNDTDVKLSTTVDVQEGENLSLTFAFKPRPSAKDSSDMKVTLGGKEVRILSDSNGDISFVDSDGVTASQTEAGNGWTLITLNYLPLEETDNIELKFEGLEPEGVQDSVGAYIDDIQLVANTVSSASITEIEDSNPLENIAVHSSRGQIAFEDVDVTDQHDVTVSTKVKDESDNVITSPLGSLTLLDNTNNTDGTVEWVFTVDDSVINHLAANESLTQVYTVTVDDENGGSVNQNITVVITGADDAPVLGGTVTGDVTEDTSLTVSGTVTITDVDTNDNPVSFTDQGSTVGDNGYGSFVLSNGAWTYTLNNSLAAVQALDVTQTLTDTITYTATDGSTQEVTVTINGTNDAPTVTAVTSTATEDDASYTVNLLAASAANDVDDDTVTYVADSASHTNATDAGGITISSAGVASVDPSHYNYLDDGESVVVEYSFKVTDGTEEVTNTATVTITGANDAPTITTDSGNTDNANDVVYEAGLASGSGIGPTTTSAGGTITFADSDGLDDLESIKINSATYTVSELNDATAGTPLTVSGEKGTLSITDYTDGVATYSYTLNSAVDHEAGASTQEEFTLTLSDGSSNSDPVSIGINIEDDAPVARSNANGVIDSNNVQRTDLGFTVKAFNPDGTDGDIGYRASPKGFGVVGKVSGASVELGADSQGSESIVVTFDTPVSSVDLVLAWQNGQEHAIIELFQEETPVGTHRIEGGTDGIDDIGTLTADENQSFTSIRFSAPTGGGHDYLINSISFNQGAVQEGATLTVTADNGVLANDESGVDGYNSPQIVGVVPGSSAGTDTKNDSVGSVINGTYGKLKLNADGSYKYLSTANALSTDAIDTFTYTIQDADGDLDSAVLSINIANIDGSVAVTNDEPDTNDGSVVGNEDSVISIPTLSGSDFDGSVESFVIESLPANGSLYVDGTEVTAEGTSVALANADKLTFEPAADWNGDTSFTYSAVDDDGAEDATPATMSISVTPTSDVFREMDIQIGTETVETSINTNFTNSSVFGALKNSGLSTFTTTDGLTLTASEGDTLYWSNGQNIGVGSNGDFRILGDNSLTFEYPGTFNTITLGVKNNSGEVVKATSTVAINGAEYEVTWSYKATNSSEYESSVTIKTPGGSAYSSDGNSSYTTGSGKSKTTHDAKIAEVTLAVNDVEAVFKVLPDSSNGNSSEFFTFESSLALDTFTIFHGGSDANNPNGFTIDTLEVEANGEAMFYEYPLALEALSTDSSGNVETLNSSFTIGGLKVGDSIVFGSNIFEADSDGNITLVGAELFNDINSDDDELTLRTSESLPDGYQLSLTVSSTENGQEMITSKGGSADDSFTGGDYADYLSGGAGDDNLIGGKGEDMLTGGLGDDVFAWTLADADGGNDTVTDFGTGSDGADSGTGVDALDLRDLLQSEDGSSASNLLGYIHISKVGNDTIVKIDADGGSDFDNYDQQITLEGIDLVTGHVDQTAMINDLLSNGKLITD